jgi:outer membrane protein OmpA-like peptidoglycan-associated protein
MNRIQRQPRSRTAVKKTDNESVSAEVRHSASNPHLQLQQTLGNQAFGQLIQAKLKISQPGDTYEQEADRLADQVMRVPDATAEPLSISSLISPSHLQRACAKCEEEEEKPELQRKAVGDGSLRNHGDEQAVIPSPVEAHTNGGESLPDSTRAYFEPAFGRDFSQVRVHAGAHADQSAREVNAQAFTVGHNIVFAAGEYAPETAAGRKLLAHELVHTVQQGSAGPVDYTSLHRSMQPSNAVSPLPREVSRTNGPALQRSTARDEEEFSGVFGENTPPPRVKRVTPPNPTAAAPPSPQPVPTAPGTFDPLSGAALTSRQTHGLSTDTGPMVSELESALFPTGGANPPCTPIPANFETTVATALSAQLKIDIPSLAPADAPDPMTVASHTATDAMPIIASHYSPHAPVRSAAAFMAQVSRKSTSAGDPIRNNASDFADFLEWYGGARATLRTLTSDKCSLDRTWWDNFVTWLGGAGSSFVTDPAHKVRERAALFDTFRTSVTQGGHIEFGRGFALSFIPHTVVHEAMHLFQHPDLDTQIGLMQAVRSSTDIIIEGFAEYLARGVREKVVDAIQAQLPPVLSPADEAKARVAKAYPFYFDQAVKIRDILYNHGQDGEESIRRAFFLGEGWRFGLLETAAGVGSPIETDRAVPSGVDVLFGPNAVAILNTAPLDPIVAYLKTRSIATVDIVGRTDISGSDAINLTRGQQRADSVQAHLVAQGINATRITTSSRGKQDQVPGGPAVNRRATVTITDPRNQFPGIPAVGRP